MQTNSNPETSQLDAPLPRVDDTHDDAELARRLRAFVTHAGGRRGAAKLLHVDVTTIDRALLGGRIRRGSQKLIVSFLDALDAAGAPR